MGKEINEIKQKKKKDKALLKLYENSQEYSFFNSKCFSSF